MPTGDNKIKERKKGEKRKEKKKKGEKRRKKEEKSLCFSAIITGVSYSSSPELTGEQCSPDCLME